MNSEQTTAFYNAAGNLYPQEFSLLIRSVLMMVMCVWVAWIGFRFYRAWINRSLAFGDFVFGLTNAAFLFMLVAYVVSEPV